MSITITYDREEHQIVYTYSHSKGSITIPDLVNKTDSDYNTLFAIAETFAQKGEKVLLPPKIQRNATFDYKKYYNDLIGTKYEGKCPDIAVKRGGKYVFYEFESYKTDNKKRALKNMLHRGLEQSDKLIIDNLFDYDATIKRSIYNRVKKGVDIDEVWMLTGNNDLKLLYKKLKD